MDSQRITGQKTRRGFNLIEAAIVLGVVGVIIGGIWVAAASVSRSMRVQQTFDGLMFIAEKVNENYGRQFVNMWPAGCAYNTLHGTITGFPCGYLTFNQLTAMKAIPHGWKLKNGKLSGPSIELTQYSGYYVFVYSNSREFLWSVDLWGTVSNVSDCQALASYVFSRIGQNTVVYAGVSGTGGTYAEVMLDKGQWLWWKNGSSGIGLPDPLFAKNVIGCNYFEIMVSRP